MRFNVCQLAMVIICILVLTACGKNDPQITADINVQGTTIDAGEQRGLSVDVVSSADVRFEWNTTAGTLSDSSSQSVIFTAPFTQGPVVVTVRVISGDQIVTDSINFDVVAPTPTQTPTPKPSSTPEPSLTPTNTAMPSNTPIPTDTLTPSRISSPSKTPSPTPSNTPTWTPVPCMSIETFEGSRQVQLFSFDPDVFSYAETGEKSYLGSRSLLVEYTKNGKPYPFLGAEIPSALRNFSPYSTFQFAVYGQGDFLLKLEDENGQQADVATLTASSPNGWTLLSYPLARVRGKVDLSRVKVFLIFPAPGDGSSVNQIYIDGICLCP